ncbi:hypothetical protein RE9431_49450 (plasmid) [Prescottella equi]|uniref:Pentapeptide repeat containing protein n=1 Tax=Rhodococcus hoagii TaxID=43767 RepID=A0A0F6WFS7_RHOHA|nr:pentapeptide repeat-containing protein [Prescottella equi]AKF16089.1 Pentapeptide repeat containing protein [Prescottella equi]ARX59739.1 Pentapeptide repeat containing protein [Prescottella equi]ARX59885.1 Pentapeptide repeat containing protein [Prescottella equi]ARX60032.1 Pentapeptide repeat containing protein [Prescottella equi]WQB72217.1 pentapeptide repeat-containing protein [Prescottella equi]
MNASSSASPAEAKTAPSQVDDGGDAPAEPEKKSRYPFVRIALYAVGAGFTAAVLWWIAAEWATADGSNVWWEKWQWWGVAPIVAAVGATVAGLVWVYRKSDRAGPDEDGLSLFRLVIAGVLAGVVMMIALVWLQAELFTAPGASLVSIGGRETLNIVRSSAFAVGALGAVAVLIVNYRKQKSTEAALVLDRGKHADLFQQAQDNLSLDREKHADLFQQAQDDLAHERQKHEKQMELERAKQAASDAAALHDRFSKAVVQLADDKPAIRLGGVYAIAGVATDWQLKNNFLHLQACVDLLCSYLRSVPSMSDKKRLAFTGVDDDAHALALDRDVRKAALEALSTLGKPDSERSSIAQLVRKWTQETMAPLVGEAPKLAVDLHGASFRNLDLRNARLAGLNLSNTDFRGAELAGASLARANLSRADFDQANLSGAILARATLTGANLTKANLTRANLAGATLYGAKVDGANFYEARGLDTMKPGVDKLRAEGGLNLPEQDDD